MRNYELMTIAKSSLTDEQAKKVSKEIQDLIVSLKGSVTKADFWGKRKLAYEIGAFKEGYYDVIHFELNPAEAKKLPGKFELMENLVKYLISLDTPKKVKEPKVKSAQA